MQAPACTIAITGFGIFSGYSGFSYVGSGGCATGTNANPPFSISQSPKVESIKECYDVCKKTTAGCTFFEYQTLNQDSSGIFCNIHFWSDIDRGNGVYGYKCFNYDSGKFALIVTEFFITGNFK